MRALVTVAVFLTAFGADLAIAQTAPPGPPTSTPPAVTPPAIATTPPPAATAPPKPITGPSVTVPPNSAASSAGAGSVSEAQARSRLEARGFSDISNLQKDAQSMWRGTAIKDGKPVRVAVDGQGNVIAQ